MKRKRKEVDVYALTDEDVLVVADTIAAARLDSEYPGAEWTGEKRRVADAFQAEASRIRKFAGGGK